MPLLVPIDEVVVYDVSSHTCKGDFTLAPLLESKIEPVVFDPLYSSNTILQLISPIIL